MDLIQRTIELARATVERGGRPFACIIAKDGAILAEGVNTVSETHDPTAHAEINAIREASAKLGTENLTGCEFYLLCHPCPMCLAAMYSCSPDRVVFITTRQEYSEFYSDQQKYFTVGNFYDEIGKPWQERAMPMVHESNPAALEIYRRWKELNPH